MIISRLISFEESAGKGRAGGAANSCITALIYFYGLLIANLTALDHHSLSILRRLGSDSARRAWQTGCG